MDAAAGRGQPRTRRRGRRLPRRRRHDAGRRRSGRQVGASRPVRRGLSQGAARPAAVHVPGVRLAARGPADAPHGDHPFRLGLLRLRADLHVALLRCQADGRLRAVRLRQPRHRQALRGHPRGGVRDRRPGPVRRDRRDQPVRADRLRRAAPAASQGHQRRAHRRHRRAGLRRADPCRGQGRARRRDAELRPRRGRSRARSRRRACAPICRPSRCWARCSRPTRSASA